MVESGRNLAEDIDNEFSARKHQDPRADKASWKIYTLGYFEWKRTADQGWEGI
jgi:hypothetical protein